MTQAETETRRPRGTILEVRKHVSNQAFGCTVCWRCCDLHWVVQNTVHDVLVSTGIRWVATEDLACGKDTGCGDKVGPEARLDMLCRVDAETID